MKLKYNRNGKFKIIQLTDTHIGEYPFNEEDQRTIQLVLKSIEMLKPDLVVHTGDIIWSKDNQNALKSFKQFVKNFNQFDVPIAITFGNHDTESHFGRNELLSIFDKECMNKADKTNCFKVDEFEAYTLEIYDSNETIVKNLLYVIDSGSYPCLDFGIYDWVKFDQVSWFNRIAKEYEKQDKVKNNILFQHIPLPEYWEASKNIINGVANETPTLISSPILNTGLFAQLYSNGEVWGMFVGHDHDNNFDGLYGDVHLVFGQVTGYNSYGNEERGVRVIELDEESSEIDAYIMRASQIY